MKIKVAICSRLRRLSKVYMYPKWHLIEKRLWLNNGCHVSVISFV